MALGLLYIFEFDSEKFRHNNLIEIWEEGYIGSPSHKALGASPILKRERGEGDGGLYGSSLELSLQSDLNEEFIKLYTTDNKKFLARHYVDNVLNWSGFILPEKYTEPNIAPPYDVQITVADGLGILKNIAFNLMGRHSILSILKYCLDNTGLALDFEIICDLKETTQDPSKTILSQVTTDVGQWAEKTCYDVLNEIASSFRAMITQHRNRWRFARFADLKSDSMIFTNNLIYLISLPNIIYNYGNTSKEIYPIGLLTQDILQAYKTCRFTRTFIKRESFLNNPSLKLLENWNVTGNVETTYDNGINYAVLEGTYVGQGISQTIQVEASERAFVLELSYFHKYDAPRFFNLTLTLSDGVNNYYLTPDGWKQIAGDPFKFNLDADSIPYTTDSESGSIYKIARGVQKTLVQTGEINFETFPISGNLTISITCLGPQNMGIDQARGKFYITGINLSTETPKGIEVKALLSESSEAASDIEIFFGDTETADNSDYQIYNNLKFLNGNYTFDWKIGINGIPDSFFNTIIKDYIVNIGLSKKSLNGSIQSSELFDLTVLDDQFSGLYYFIDTFSHDLLNDEMAVTLIELIPYMEIASIASEEIIETSPEIVIDYQRQPDGTLRKVYTVAGPGTFFKRGAGSTLEDLRNQSVIDLRRISNFSKALAALSQERADAANLKALEASNSAADALLRLNNIVSNNIISREEKAGLKELISRLAQEMTSYEDEVINKGADIEALQTAYDALTSFLNDVAKINIDEPTELLSEQVTTYNSLFSDFYAKRSVFSTDISKVRSELVSYQNRIISIVTDKIRCDAEYTSLHSTDLAEAIATALTAAYNEYVTAHGNYKTGLETIIADDKIIAEERTAALNLQTIYSDKLSAFHSEAEAAKKSITDSIGTTLSAWTADGVISPLEKLAVKQTKAQVLTEKESIVSDAGVYEISTDAYLAKWTAYDAALAKYSADEPETIPIEADFATTENEYRAAKVAILQAVANVNKSTSEQFTLSADHTTLTTDKNIVTNKSIAFYGEVGEEAPVAPTSLTDLNDVDPNITGAPVGSVLVKLANNKWGQGSVSIDLSNYYDKSTSDSRFAFKSHSHDYVSPTTFNSHTGDTVKHLTAAERTAWNGKEPALGNPDVDGKILASTVGGVRSWVSRYVLPVAAAAMLGGVMIGSNISVTAQGVISVAAPYSHPATHAASMIDTDATRRFISDAQLSNLADAYNLRHSHGNKANLDTINQDLSKTSNVQFNNLIADGSIGFYGGVGSGSTPVASLLDLSDIDASISTAATGTPLVKLSNGKWGAGSISIDLSNYYNKSDADARYAFKSHSHDYISPTTFNGHTGRTDNPHGVTFSQLGGKPITLSGYGVSSTDTMFDGKYLGVSGNAVSANRLEFEPLSDLNDGTIGRIFTSAGGSSTNAPDGWTSGYTMAPNNDVLYKWQLVQSGLSSVPRLYARSQIAGTWGGWYELYHTANLLNIGSNASSARTAIELTGTVSTHNHNGTYAIIGGSTSQAFSASTFTENGTALASKYLGISANAVSASKLKSLSGYDANAMSGGGMISNYNSTTYWANLPAYFSYGTVYNLSSTRADEFLSTQIGADTDDNFIFRISNAGGWGSWRKLWHTGNLTNALTSGYLPYWNGSSLVNSLFYCGTVNSGEFQLKHTGISSTVELTYTTADTIILNGYYKSGGSPYSRYLDIASVGAPDGTNGGSIIRFLTNPITNGASAIERVRISPEGNFDIGYGGTRTEKLAVNGTYYGASYIESASYLKGLSVRLGTWEIKENASGELEFIQSGTLRFKGTSLGLISQKTVAFYD